MKSTNSPELAGLYCPSLLQYKRFLTREVHVGDLGMGANNPIRIQSMTTTDTMDTQGTVAQSIRMIEAGCELVRITAPSIKEAQNLAEIKKELNKRGYHTPLVADIHFTPNAAELAALSMFKWAHEHQMKFVKLKAWNLTRVAISSIRHLQEQSPPVAQLNLLAVIQILQSH